MRTRCMLVVLAMSAMAAAPAAADVQLSITNGQVTLSAKDATPRQILAEWARVGHTTIVNGDRVPGGPLTLELTNVPERQALEILLRSASGYVAAPRPALMANASQFDRIVVMPTSSPARPPAPAPQQPAQPRFQPPVFAPPQPPIEDEDADPDEPPSPAVPPNAPQPPRGPVFNTFPQPRPAGPPPQSQPTPSQPPASPTTYTPTPAAPVGVSTPGMVVPTPQQEQPGQPGVQQRPRTPDGRVID